MNSATTCTLTSASSEITFHIGERLGVHLRGGEAIELVGDLGAGKTQLTRGIAAGIGSRNQVQSPTFTLMREYTGEHVTVHHYDFYRLQDAGVVGEEFQESLADDSVAVVVEWSAVIADALPQDRLRIEFSVNSETERTLTCSGPAAIIATLRS